MNSTAGQKCNQARLRVYLLDTVKPGQGPGRKRSIRQQTTSWNKDTIKLHHKQVGLCFEVREFFKTESVIP